MCPFGRTCIFRGEKGVSKLGNPKDNRTLYILETILNKRNLENYKKSGKIYVSNFEKIIETLLSIFDLIKLSLISKNDDNIKHDHNLINEEINLNERI